MAVFQGTPGSPREAISDTASDMTGWSPAFDRLQPRGPEGFGRPIRSHDLNY